MNAASLKEKVFPVRICLSLEATAICHGEGAERVGVGEEARDVGQGEMPLPVLERVDRDQDQGQHHEDDQEHQVRDAPAGTLNPHWSFVSLKADGAMATPTRSSLSQISWVST